MKTADLKPGDHIAVVAEIRPRKSYGWDRTNTIGLRVPELVDDVERTFWVQPREIVSTWTDELRRRGEVEKAHAEREARETLTIDANSPRLEAVRQLAEILTSTAGGPLTERQEQRLLLGSSYSVYIDLDKLEALTKALAEVSP